METQLFDCKITKGTFSMEFFTSDSQLHCLYYGGNKWLIEMIEDSFLINVRNKLQHIYNFEVS